MGTNSNTKQVPYTLNDFIKGIDTDTSSYLIESSKYRDALNLRILTNKGSNTGELHKIEGSQLLCDLNYIHVGIQPNKTDFSNWSVFKSLVIRNYGILFIKSTTNWAIVRFEFQDGNLVDENSPRVIFQSNLSKNDIMLDENISVVANYENQNTIKLYIADGNTYVHIINISPSQDTYNADTNRKYSDYLSYSEISLSPAKFYSMTTGSLKYGTVCYSYRFILKNGIYTEFSPVTGTINIADLNSNGTYKNGNTSTLSSNTGVIIKIPVAKDSSGSTYQTISGIQVYRIYYSQQGTLAKVGLIKEDYTYDSTIENTIYDVTNDFISELTLEEFNASSGLHIKPTILEYKKDYLFAANITNDKQNQSEVEFVDSSNNIFYSWSRGWLNNSTNQNSGNDAQTIIQLTQTENNGVSFDNQNYSAYNFNVPMWQFMSNYNTRKIDKDFPTFTKDGKYFGGTGPYIDYKFLCTFTKVDDFSYGSTNSNVLVYNQDATSAVYSYPILNSDESCDITNAYQYLDVANKITTLFDKEIYQDYSDPLFTYNFKSLRRDEIYRYGIIYYDKNGIATPVQWITDVRIPSIYTPGFDLYRLKDNKLWIRTIQIAFNVKELPKNAVSYEIVRCARTSNDRKTLTQGYINRSIRSYGASGYSDSTGTNTGGAEPNDLITVTSSGFYTNHFKLNGHNTADTLFEFPYELITPEIDYQFDTMKTNLVDKTLFLEPLQYQYSMPIFTDESNAQTHGINKVWNGYASTNSYDAVTPSEIRIGSYNGKLTTYDKDDWYKYTFAMFYGLNIETSSFYQDIVCLPDDYYLPIQISNQYRYSRPRPQISVTDDPYTYKSSVYGVLKYYTYSNKVFFRKDSDYTDPIAKPTELPKTTKGVSLDVSYNKPIFGYFKLNDINYTTESTWSDYSNRKDKITAINGISFNNWIFCGGYGVTLEDVNENSRLRRPYGPNGRSFVISVNPEQYAINGISFTEENGYYNRLANSRGVLGDTTRSLIGSYLCNIQQQIVPYGGLTEYGRSSSVYYSYGDYCNSVGTYTISKSGDTYPDVLEHSKIHKWYDATYLVSDRECIFYYLPCESDINMKLAYGIKNYNGKVHDNVQIAASDVYNMYSQSRPQYEYNTVYSISPNSKLLSQENEKEKIQDKNINTDVRCYYSNRKTNGEFGDSWAIYQSANFLDVDSRYGAITDIKDYNNYLIFWQEKAIGRFSVQERSLLKDSNSLTLTLGTGDILDRYDYFSYVYGMKKGQYSKCITQNNLYWWDANKKAILQLNSENGITNLAKAKSTTNLINSTTSFVENPKIVYDSKYDEVLFNLTDDSTIVYNEFVQNFSSRYSMNIESQLVFKDFILFTNSVNSVKLYKWNYGDYSNLLGNTYTVSLQYVVNDQPNITRVYDNQDITGTITDLSKLDITYTTDLQNTSGVINGNKLTNRELNYRLSIPRGNNASYGNRMRGKVLNVSVKYKGYDEFALYSILTKYRQSWI